MSVITNDFGHFLVSWVRTFIRESKVILRKLFGADPSTMNTQLMRPFLRIQYFNRPKPIGWCDEPDEERLYHITPKCNWRAYYLLDYIHSKDLIGFLFSTLSTSKQNSGQKLQERPLEYRFFSGILWYVKVRHNHTLSCPPHHIIATSQRSAGSITQIGERVHY